MLSVKQEMKRLITAILKEDEESYESIAAYIGVASNTVRRWHKSETKPHKLFVSKVSEYLQSIQ